MLYPFELRAQANRVNLVNFILLCTTVARREAFSSSLSHPDYYSSAGVRSETTPGAGSPGSTLIALRSLNCETNPMRAVVQRVSRAQVSVGEEITGKIGAGMVVLLGVAKSDSQDDADYIAAKVLGLRIFEDENGKMNLSLAETHGAVLAVSQFTLYGDARKGRRPSFDQAAPPQQANELYEYFVRKIREAGFVCETGRFQAMMKVDLINDGPVTILLDSARAF
jgi:D-aminoacyl-tRNA deacylase